MKQSNDLNRRDFIRGSSLAAMMAMMGGIDLRAQAADDTNAEALTAIPVGPTVNFGIIGLGRQARDILTVLGQMPNTPIVAICDNYPSALNKAGDAAPKAVKYDDYKKLLEDKNVQAVIVATPTHLHRDIVIDAIKSGKHVYCEAPIASTIEDARAIALAAKDNIKTVFQTGLSLRAFPPIVVKTDKQAGLLTHLRSGDIGTPISAYAQWRKKVATWVAPARTPERQKEVNWRLQSAVSAGLMGEIGIHQIDLVSWFLNKRPIAINGWGSLMNPDNKNDNMGFDTPDTVQGLFEYAGGINFMYDVTVANSFDSEYELFHGLLGTIMRHGSQSWLFKESDAQQLGFEVYANKEDVMLEHGGISLMAGATQQDAHKFKDGDATGNKNTGAADPFPNTPLYYSLAAFTANAGLIGATVADYLASFGDADPDGLKEQLASLKLQIRSYAGWKEGYEATVMAIKANEAVTTKQRLVVKDEWFSL